MQGMSSKHQESGSWNASRRGVQLRDQGIVPVQHTAPPPPPPQSHFASRPRRDGRAYDTSHITPNRGLLPRSVIARPGDIVLLQSSPRSGLPKVQRLPPRLSVLPQPTPLRRPLPQPANADSQRRSITARTTAQHTVVRQLRGPRVTPAPKASVVHVNSFRASIASATPPPAPSVALGTSSPRATPSAAVVTSRSNLRRKSTVRGPRPAPGGPNITHETRGTLQRRRAVSRMSRMSTTSGSSRKSSRALPIPPAGPAHIQNQPHCIPHEGSFASPDTESEGSSPDLTLQWQPDMESAQAGTDEAEETWRRMEMRIGKRLRDSTRQRGRWIVTPRLGATPKLGASDTTPLLGGVGFPDAVPTGNDANSSIPGVRSREGATLNMAVDDSPGRSCNEPGVCHVRAGSEGSVISTSSAFTISAYLDGDDEEELDARSSSDSSQFSLPMIDGLPAMFDMTQPLICGTGLDHDKTPMNTPILHGGSLKRADRVSKRPEGLLSVEYLGGRGMLVRDESVRSAMGREEARVSRLAGQAVKISREVESTRLDTQVLDTLRALADRAEPDYPIEEAESPLETELDLHLLDYVASPPLPVQWLSRPLPRLPLPPPEQEIVTLATPRSAASIAIDEMFDLLQHHQEELQQTLQATRNSPKPQYTDRIYGSPESVDIPPPVALAPLPRMPHLGEASGLGLGINLRLDSIYGVPSLANARIRLLSPRLSESDSQPLPFATTEAREASQVASPLDFCLPEDPPLQTIVIRDLDTGKAVNFDLGQLAPDQQHSSPVLPQKKEKDKWWTKKLFGK